jgi:hypothetical protein
MSKDKNEVLSEEHKQSLAGVLIAGKRFIMAPPNSDQERRAAIDLIEACEAVAKAVA